MNLNYLIHHKLTSCFCPHTYISFDMYYNFCVCCVPPFVEQALWWVARLCMLITFNSYVGFHSTHFSVSCLAIPLWSPAFCS